MSVPSMCYTVPSFLPPVAFPEPTLFQVLFPSRHSSPSLLLSQTQQLPSHRHRNRHQAKVQPTTCRSKHYSD